MSKMHEMTGREFADVLQDYANQEDSYAARARAALDYRHHVAIGAALREAARRLSSGEGSAAIASAIAGDRQHGTQFLPSVVVAKFAIP